MEAADSALSASTLNSATLTRFTDFIANYEGIAISGQTSVASIEAMHGVSYNADTGNFYKLSDNSFNFSNAQNDATSGAGAVFIAGVGGFIATSNSAAENAFLDSLSGTQEIWLGSSTSFGTTDNWTWNEGAEAGDLIWDGTGSFAPAGTYTNWVSGDPNEAGDAGLRMVNGGEWRDSNANTGNFRYVAEVSGDEAFAAVYDSISNVAFANVLIEAVSHSGFPQNTASNMLDVIEYDGVNAHHMLKLLRGYESGDLQGFQAEIFVDWIEGGILSQTTYLETLDLLVYNAMSMEVFSNLVEYAQGQPGAEDSFFSGINDYLLNGAGTNDDRANIVNNLFQDGASTMPDIQGDTLSRLLEITDLANAVDTGDMLALSQDVASGKIEGYMLDQLVDLIDDTGNSFSLNDGVDVLSYITDGSVSAGAAGHLLQMLNNHFQAFSPEVDHVGFDEFMDFMRTGNQEIGATLVESIWSADIEPQTGFILKDMVAAGQISDTGLERLLEYTDSSLVSGGIDRVELNSFVFHLEGAPPEIDPVDAANMLGNIGREGFTTDFVNDVMLVANAGPAEIAFIEKMLAGLQDGHVDIENAKAYAELVATDGDYLYFADNLLDKSMSNGTSPDVPAYLRLAEEMIIQAELPAGDPLKLPIGEVNHLIDDYNISGTHPTNIGANLAPKILENLHENPGYSLSDAINSINVGGNVNATHTPGLLNPVEKTSLEGQLVSKGIPIGPTSLGDKVVNRISKDGLLEADVVQDLLLSSGYSDGVIFALLNTVTAPAATAIPYTMFKALVEHSAELSPGGVIENILDVAGSDISFGDLSVWMEYLQQNIDNSANGLDAFELDALATTLQSGRLTGGNAMEIAFDMSQNDLTSAQNESLMQHIANDNISDDAGVKLFDALSTGTASGLDYDGATRLIDRIPSVLNETEFGNIMDNISAENIDGWAVNQMMQHIEDGKIGDANGVDFLLEISNGNVNGQDLFSFNNAIDSGQISATGADHFVSAIQNGHIDAAQSGDMIEFFGYGTLSPAGFDSMLEAVNANGLSPDIAISMMGEVHDGDIVAGDLEGLFTDYNLGNISHDSFDFASYGVESGVIDSGEFGDLVSNLDATIDAALNTLANGNTAAVESDLENAGWTEAQEDVVGDFIEINQNLTDALPDPDGNLFDLEVPTENEDALVGYHGV